MHDHGLKEKKFYKRDRRSFSRQNSRVNNLTDVSSLHINKRSPQNKIIALPKEVMNLLDASNVEHINNEPFLGSNDSDTDSDHDDPFSLHLDIENFD